MLDLPINRLNGSYFITKQDEKLLNVESFYSASRNWVSKFESDGQEYFIKRNIRENTYFNIFQCAELMYQDFAKENGLPCADVDIGYIGGLKAIISKSVLSSDCERLSCNLFISEMEDLLGGNTQTYSVENLTRLAKIYCEMNGLTLENGFEQKLFLISLFDYLAVHSDRSEFNLLFEIDNNKKVFKVCPVFDNEFTFGIMNLSVYFEQILNSQEHELYRLVSNNQLDDITLEQIEEHYDGDIRTITPAVYLPVDFDAEKYIPNFFGESNYPIDRITNTFADYLCKNDKLLKIFQNIKFNAKKSAERIKEKTGFVIPEFFIQMAQELFNDRYTKLESKYYLAMFYERGV